MVLRKVGAPIIRNPETTAGVVLSVIFLVSLFFIQTKISEYAALHFTEAHVTAVFGGLFAGSLHALSGPDHLAAILPLILGKNWVTASYYGCTWGYGHGLSSSLLGVLGFFLKDSFVRKNVLPQLTTLADYAVGVTLIIIGIMGVLEIQQSESDGEATPILPIAAAEEGQDQHGEVPLSSKWGSQTSEPLVATDAVRVSTAVLAENELSQISPRLRQLAATMTVFANGFLLGLSWDGLPSLAPTLALDSWHTLFCFLAAYCAGTVGGIGGTSVVIAASTRWLSAVTSDEGMAGASEKGAEGTAAAPWAFDDAEAALDLPPPLEAEEDLAEAEAEAASKAARAAAWRSSEEQWAAKASASDLSEAASDARDACGCRERKAQGG